MSAETATDWRSNGLYLYSTPGFETTPNTTVEFSSTSTQRQSSPAKITSLRENTKLISAFIVAAAVIFVICGAVLLVCLKKRWVSATYSLWIREGYKCEHLTDCCYFRMAEQRITVIRTRDPLQITGSREQGNSFGLPYMNVYSKRKIPHSSSLCFECPIGEHRSVHIGSNLCRSMAKHVCRRGSTQVFFGAMCQNFSP